MNHGDIYREVLLERFIEKTQSERDSWRTLAILAAALLKPEESIVRRIKALKENKPNTLCLISKGKSQAEIDTYLNSLETHKAMASYYLSKSIQQTHAIEQLERTLLKEQKMDVKTNPHPAESELSVTESKSRKKIFETAARAMFGAYNAQGPRHGPNPPWESLGEQVQGKWIAAAKAAVIHTADWVRKMRGE